MEQHLRLKNKRRLSTAGVATVASFVLFAACHHPGSPVIKTSAVAVDGTIAGLVHATSGTVALSGRSVAAVNVNTGQRYETTTGLNGGYTMKVPEGMYRLEVELHDGESLARQPDPTHVKTGDLDTGRNFEVTVRTAGQD